jgi:capsid protein
VRQLVRDFPILARAVEIGTTYTVGDGIRFQSRVKDPSGKIDKMRIQLIEDEFAFWMDGADIARRPHYYEIMAFAKRQDLETGEFLIVKKLVNEPGRRLPLALQVYEGDWLSDLAAKPANPAHLVKQGIEYDPATGRVVAYHLADPEGFAKAERVPAESLIHGLKTLRPGQLRGISPYAPGVLLAKDLQDLMDAELDASKMAAKYLPWSRPWTPPSARQRSGQ